MFSLFDKTPKELLGIDIGTKQIKIIELERPARHASRSDAGGETGEKEPLITIDKNSFS